ncbi:hypothetical protein ACHAWO_009746 [Cyclotella atomus]|uniref:Uncharacterized protein n=1 Tax=Cyclotella atomus TaxID=382360 RepID=A0ABD3PV80_9STRA
MTMDSLPPNDPNGNNNNNNHRAKIEALDPTPRPSGTNENGDMEMFGDLQDNGFVVVMFLMSVAGWMYFISEGRVGSALKKKPSRFHISVF